MNQHTYSFPKVTPVDPDELREDLRAARRDLSANPDSPDRDRDEIRTRRISSDG